MQIQEKDFLGKAIGTMAVEELADYAKSRLVEMEKTKRLLIAVVALLTIASGLILVFAPEGKQGIAGIMGTVLLVLALGAIGASRFILRTPFATIETSESQESKDGESKPSRGDRDVAGERKGYEEESKGQPAL